MKQDYTPLLTLFQESVLTLIDGLEIPSEAHPLLEEVLDAAIASPFAAISGGKAIEIVNRDAFLEQRTPFVHISVVGSGILTLQSCTLRLIAFDEVVERLQAPFEAFELFLFSEKIPYHHSYRRNLSAWQRVDASLIGKFRAWLPSYYPSDTDDKLQAVKLYCRLAAKEGYLLEDELDVIIEAINKPLPRRSGKKPARSKQG